ncbi:MAG: hypothetical protein ACP5FL_00160 [Thermoplasmatota archaeon]
MTYEKKPRITKRTIPVYLPTIEMKERWKTKAEEVGLSASKFVIEYVENSLMQEENKDIYSSRAELMEQIKDLKDENTELRKRNKMLDTLIGRMDEDMKRYRTKPFMQDEFYGIREYEEQLINIFKERGKVRKEEIYELLDIDPMKNSDIVKGINRQLEMLERYGMIEDKGKVWVWNG